MRKPFIIAEAGSCHEGEYKQAEHLVQLAKDADADAVKFQYWSSSLRMRERRHVDDPLAYEHGSIFTDWLPGLSERAHELGLEFMCTTYLPEDIEVIAPYVDRFKVASFEASDYGFVAKHGGYDKEIIVSDGMSDAWGGGGRYDYLWDTNKPPRGVTFLQCVSAYPCPLSEAGIGVLLSYRDDQSIYNGYSDHTRCIYTGGFAVSAGANILEVHYRLDNTSETCPDYPVALSPEGLAQYITIARLAHMMRGDGEKRSQPSELVNIKHRVIS